MNKSNNWSSEFFQANQNAYFRSEVHDVSLLRDITGKSQTILIKNEKIINGYYCTFETLHNVNLKLYCFTVQFFVDKIMLSHIKGHLGYQSNIPLTFCHTLYIFPIAHQSILYPKLIKTHCASAHKIGFNQEHWIKSSIDLD